MQHQDLTKQFEPYLWLQDNNQPVRVNIRGICLLERAVNARFEIE